MCKGTFPFIYWIPLVINSNQHQGFWQSQLTSYVSNWRQTDRYIANLSHCFYCGHHLQSYVKTEIMTPLPDKAHMFCTCFLLIRRMKMAWVNVFHLLWTTHLTPAGPIKIRLVYELNENKDYVCSRYANSCDQSISLYLIPTWSYRLFVIEGTQKVGKLGNYHWHSKFVHDIHFNFSRWSFCELELISLYVPL